VQALLERLAAAAEAQRRARLARRRHLGKAGLIHAEEVQQAGLYHAEQGSGDEAM
jgi:hypothetical protein